MTTFHLAPPIHHGPFRIIVIEERRLRGSGRGVRGWLAESRPHAVVVAAETAVRCLDPAGRPLELTALLERVPALAALLRKTRPQ